MDTIFQKIISGEIPANKVYEDGHTLAFLDISPVNKGHTLVIPKTPVRDMLELSEEDAIHLMRTIRKVTLAVKEVTQAPGINVISNNGAEAGQVVFHLHFHIIPRFSKDEFQPMPHVSYETEDEQKEYARKLMNAIQ